MEFPEPDELQAVIHQHVSRFPFQGCSFGQIRSDACERFSLKASLIHHDHVALRGDPVFTERVWGAICVLMYEEKIKQSFEDDIVLYRCLN